MAPEKVTKAGGPLRVSKAGRNMIAGFEGLSLKPYNDEAGHATIGYGHLIHSGPVTPTDRAFSKDFTKEKAEKLLISDLQRFEHGVLKVVTVPLAQRELDALVSLAFNIGLGAKGFGGSAVLRQLNINNRRGAADAFLLWDKVRVDGKLRVSKGLVRRRKAERAHFLG